MTEGRNPTGTERKYRNMKVEVYELDAEVLSGVAVNVMDVTATGGETNTLADWMAKFAGSTTDNAIARYDSTVGKFQNSGVTISDAGIVAGAYVTATGGSTPRTLADWTADVQKTRDALRFQVQDDRTIRDPYGARYIVKGVSDFHDLLVSFEARTDELFRETGGAAPPAGVSRPTYYARYVYQNAAFVEAHIKTLVGYGVNHIRLGVEAAMENASISYVDASDGLTYPSDMTMCDTIVDICERYRVVVQLQSARDTVATADNASFLAFVGDRYKERPYVWINTANEINASNADLLVPAAWVAEQATLVAAIRASGFQNPIVLNPTRYGFDLMEVAAGWLGNSTLANDRNLVAGLHYYMVDGHTAFAGTGQDSVETAWEPFLEQWASIVDECGPDNLAGRYDPDIDVTPSVDETIWGHMKLWARQFLNWNVRQAQLGRMQGVIGFNWLYYVPGPAVYSDNTMTRTDGTLTTWGSIFTRGWLRKDVLVPAQAVDQVELVKSGSNLLLRPKNGNKIIIDGVIEEIPPDGITLSTAGLAADTTYNIYVWMVQGSYLRWVPTLVASLSVRETDLSSGVDVAANLPQFTFVGTAWTNASTAWVDCISGRGVLATGSSTARALADRFRAKIRLDDEFVGPTNNPTVALENAITKANAYQTDGERFGAGADIEIERGRYSVEGSELPDITQNGVQIIGADRFSTVLRNTEATSNTLRFRGTDYLTARKYGGGGVRDLGFDCSAADPTAGAAIIVVNWDHIDISKCFITSYFQGIEARGTSNLGVHGTHIEAGVNTTGLQAGSCGMALRRQAVDVSFPGRYQDAVDSLYYVAPNSTFLSGSNFRSAGGVYGFSNAIDVGSCDGLYIDNTHVGSAVNACLHVKPEQANLGPNNIVMAGGFLDPAGTVIAKHAVWFENNAAFTPITVGHSFNGVRTSLAAEEAYLFDCVGVSDVSLTGLNISYSGRESINIRRGGSFGIVGGVFNTSGMVGSEKHITLAEAATLTRVKIAGCTFAGNDALTLAGTVSNFEFDSQVAASLTAEATLPVKPEHYFLYVSGTTQIDTIPLTYTGHRIIIRATASFTVGHATNGGIIRLNGGLNFAMTSNLMLELVCDVSSNNWTEVGRRA